MTPKITSEETKWFAEIAKLLRIIAHNTAIIAGNTTPETEPDLEPEP